MEYWQLLSLQLCVKIPLYKYSDIPSQKPRSHRVVFNDLVDVGDILQQQADTHVIKNSVLKDMLCYYI